MVKVVIELIDKLAPGYKTYGVMGLGMLMMVCQMMGYHHFTPEAWGLVGIGGAMTYKMGVDRKG